MGGVWGWMGALVITLRQACDRLCTKINFDALHFTATVMVIHGRRCVVRSSRLRPRGGRSDRLLPLLTAQTIQNEESRHL